MKLFKKLLLSAMLATAGMATAATAQISTIADPSLSEQINFRGNIGPLSGNIELSANKSMVLQSDTVIGHTMIASSDIADIVPMTDRSVYLLGKKKGTTSITFFDKQQNLLGVFDLNVSHNLNELKRGIQAIAPGEAIEVRQNGDTVIISGTASTPEVASQIVELAERHAPGKVHNSLLSTRSQQVMLSVRIAEVQRSVSKNLGLRYSTFFDDVPGLGVLNGILDPNIFASGVLEHTFGNNSALSINMAIDALEESGALTTLAEPTLVAISGEPAYFLAGGEFPVPVASEASGNGVTITVEFKEFGVKLAYTPTVIGDTINLVIEPEVSVLDPASGIELNNIVIPGLIVRRAQTTVDLKNGQSFAIAGLLQENFEDTISQVPGLGNIPILGALARSSRYQKRETELMIVVTPYLVRPDESGNMSVPTDDFVRPTDADIFLKGMAEGAANYTLR